ncbi:hypothetical protein D3C80_2043630 [compost metagenome]
MLGIVYFDEEYGHTGYHTTQIPPHLFLSVAFYISDCDAIVFVAVCDTISHDVVLFISKSFECCVDDGELLCNEQLLQ